MNTDTAWPRPALIAIGLSLVFSMVAAACSQAKIAGPTTTTSTTAPANVPYSTEWLCKPGMVNDPCAQDLDATAVYANGTTKIEKITAPKNPPIDCFYVYPTVSPEPTLNADLTIQPAETGVAHLQASRFSQDCNVYAPMYRQITLSGLVNPNQGVQSQTEAYSGVASAWADYMAHYNHGRGVVLIGHSQGSFMLEALISNVIQKDPYQLSRLVSALILGGNVKVATASSPTSGSAVTSSSTGSSVTSTTSGGLGNSAPAPTFTNVPACASTSQIGCVVAYSTFNQVPPVGALFGRTSSGGGGSPAAASAPLQILCVNPVVPGTSKAESLEPYQLGSGSLTLGTTNIPITTPWITYPDLFTGQCQNQDGAQWLQVNETRGAGDNRPVLTGGLPATWGLHLFDVNIALGNLVSLVNVESKAWLTKHK